jgi:hypothetical protein
MEAITAAVHELAAHSVRVLSPADPRIIAQQGEFLFVASDSVRSIRLVQDRHLESIRASDFLWLVCPDGYVGQSASMELGFAAAYGVPIFTTRMPDDWTLREYVKIVPTLSAAVKLIASGRREKPCGGILIDPQASVDHAHLILERIGAVLKRPGTLVKPERRIHGHIADLRAKLSLPTYTQ